MTFTLKNGSEIVSQILSYSPTRQTFSLLCRALFLFITTKIYSETISKGKSDTLKRLLREKVTPLNDLISKKFRER